jgi:hypothetical protein
LTRRWESRCDPSLCWWMKAAALVQIAGSAEIFLISMDTLLIEEDSNPNGGCCGVLEPECAELELPLANAMHQLDA